MSALEQLGRHVAGSGRERLSETARELVALHLVDTDGAWIASTRTAEGASLLRFRAAMRARGQGAWALDLAIRCALARLSEIDDIHLPSMTTPGAIVIPGALTLAGAPPGVPAPHGLAARLARTEAPPGRRRRGAGNPLRRHVAALFRRALGHGRRGRAALQARRGGERARAGAGAHAGGARRGPSQRGHDLALVRRGQRRRQRAQR